MSQNGISHLSTRQARQDAKLALAASKRTTDGRRHTLEKTQLPNPYINNTVPADSTPNTGGLVQGRPWTT